MKTIIIISSFAAVLSFAFLSSGCNKESARNSNNNNSNPICISPINSGDTVYAGQPLTFNLCQYNSSATLLWDFGDGVTSTTAGNNNYHTYTSPGNYIFTLTETSGSNTYSNTANVVVRSQPAGFWAFDGQIYSSTYGGTAYGADMCDTGRIPYRKVLLSTATHTGGAGNVDSLWITFYNYPTASGTYAVSSSFASSSSVVIREVSTVNNVPVVFLPASSNLPNVHVTVANGKITVTGTGVPMVNQSHTSDLESISFSVTQQ